MPDPLRPLTVNQRRFVEEYLRNGERVGDAYVAAYPNFRGSARTATNEGSYALKDPRIAAIVAEARAAAAAKTQAVAETYAAARATDVAEVIDRYVISRDRVMAELATMGFSSMEDYLVPNEDGELVLSLKNLTPRQLAALSEVTVETYVEGRGKDARTVKRTKIKLHDKKASLALLMQANGWDEPEPDTPAGQVDTLKRARVRAEMLRLLADMAKPTPLLIEGNAEDGD